MIEKKGNIVNIGSTSVKKVYEKSGIYCSIKHAVNALKKRLCIGSSQAWVKIPNVHSGATKTEFF